MCATGHYKINYYNMNVLLQCIFGVFVQTRHFSELVSSEMGFTDTPHEA